MSRRLKAAMAVMALAACLVTTACGGSSTKTSTGTSPAASSNAASEKATSGPGAIKVVMLGGATSDPFMASVIAGAKDATAAMKKYGASLEYLGPPNYDNFGPDMARLEQTALAQKPTVVIVPNFIPGAQLGGLVAFKKAGIPMIQYNAGSATWQGQGALMFIGADDVAGGKTAGQEFLAAGAKNVMCVNNVPGQSATEARCEGVKESVEAGGGTYKLLELPSTTYGNPAAVTQAIKGALLTDSKVDAVVTISAVGADEAFGAITAANDVGKVKLGSFDLSTSVIQRVIDGQQVFAIDQQPYVQGYYAVSAAVQYAKFGLLPAVGWLKTGPLVITKANAKQALAGAKEGIRGAA
jgi:simple sugar transport system substrate-binding protein